MYVVFIGGSVLALNKGCWLTLADTTTKLRMSPPPPALLFKSVILIILFSSQCSLVILDDLFRLLKVDSYRYLKALRAISKPALKKKKKRMGVDMCVLVSIGFWGSIPQRYPRNTALSEV